MQAKLGTTDRRHTILIIGISRGIGRGLAAEYLRRGWFVIGTVRSSTVIPELEAMAAGMAGRLRVERLDITRPSEIDTLSGTIVRLGRLGGVPTPVHARVVGELSDHGDPRRRT